MDEVSEVTLMLMKPQKGETLGGFASLVVNRIYIGGIAIHLDALNRSIRTVYPTKKLRNGQQIPLAHPINKQLGDKIQDAIAKEWRRLIS